MINHKKKDFNSKTIKELQNETNFIQKIFSVLSVPSRMGDDSNNDDDSYVYINPKNAKKSENDDKSLKRAQNIVHLREKLEKMKQDNNYSLKTKLMKKSLTTKLNKKARRAERKLKGKQKNGHKPTFHQVKNEDVKPDASIVNQTKPVFNSDGKLVFSKFDFTNVGKGEKKSKNPKDPKKLLENLKKQEETVKQLKESGNTEKATEIEQKVAWKNALAKAEGEKVKDDPLLLKKSLKRMDQMKKQSKKKWEERNKKVEQSKQDRQNKRQENIDKKKKEKKSKKIKRATKKGRVVL